MLWIHHKRPKEQTNLLLLIQFFIFRYLLYTFWCYFQRKSPVMDYIKIVDPKQMYGNSYFISVFSLLLLLELLFLCISCQNLKHLKNEFIYVLESLNLFIGEKQDTCIQSKNKKIIIQRTTIHLCAILIRIIYNYDSIWLRTSKNILLILSQIICYTKQEAFILEMYEENTVTYEY